VATCPTVVTTLNTAVFRKKVPNGAVFHASGILDHCGCSGSRDELGLMISLCVFSAAAIIHSSGKTTIRHEIVTRT
jgi:hypothetical protein